MATIIREDFTRKDFSLKELTPEQQLAYLQEIVDGPIQIIKIELAGIQFDMVMNEEGRPKGLPINRTATMLTPLIPAVIVGVVVICAQGEMVTKPAWPTKKQESEEKVLQHENMKELLKRMIPESKSIN